jgi:hypothetical protein
MRIFFVLCLLLFSAFGNAQQEWVPALKGVAGGLIGDLRVQPTDSLCVSKFKTSSDFNVNQASSIEAVFINQLSAAAKGARIEYPCASPDGIQVIGELSFEGEYIQTIVDVPAKDWHSKVLLPQVENLSPQEMDVFNQQHFQLPSLPAKATILRMSGDELPCTLIANDGIDLVFDTERKGKTKRRKLHKSEVFAVKFETGEWVLYAPDAFLGDELTVDEMRVFMAGEQDGRNHDVLPTVLIGVVVGAAGPIVSEGGLVLTVLPVIAYGLFPLIPYIKVQGKNISNPGYKYNELYAEGYERSARPKKVVGAFKGAGAGMVAGVLAFFLMK